MEQPLTLSTDVLAALLNAAIEGPAQTFSGLAMLEDARPGELTFAGNIAFAKEVLGSPALGVLAPADLPIPHRPDQTILRVPNVDAAMITLLEKLAPPLPAPPVGIHPSAVIAPDAAIAPDARIGPHVVVESGAQIAPGVVLMAGAFVGQNAHIGPHSVLWPHAVVRERCILGARVVLHCGAVIGGDGFGYHFAAGRHVKVPHLGNVVIEDDVEIGSNTTIDRGKFAATIIGAGSKLDNLIQIGHNVSLGKHCVLVGHTAIGGSTRTGDYLVMGGGSVISDHLKIGRGVQIAGLSALNADGADGERYAGAPAVPATTFFSLYRAARQVPRLLKRVDALEQRSQKTDAPTDDRP